jgi:hypothetical protein
MKRNYVVAAGAVIVVGVLMAVLLSPMLLPPPVTTQGKVSLESSSATYFGGPGTESIGSMLQAPDGSIYFSGTVSGGQALPYSMAGYDVSMGGASDLFVAHMSNDMKQLLGCTYLGGSGVENSTTLCLEPDGDLLVAGWTNSTNFLSGMSAEGTEAVNTGSAFVLRLSSNLSEMKAGGLFGAAEARRMLIVSNDQVIYLAETKSVSDLRTDDEGAENALNGTKDGALLLLDAGLSHVVADTYVGGAGTDSVSALLLKSDGSLLVGGTCSAEIDQVPVRRPAMTIEGAAASEAPAYSSGKDGFIGIWESNLSALRSLAYVPGAGDQSILDLEMDANGQVFFLGQTTGAVSGMRSSAFDSSFSGGSNCFVGKMSSDLSSMEAMSYVGESRTGGRDIKLVGERLMVAVVSEGDAPLTSNAMDGSANGAGDIGLLLFDKDLGQLAYGSYVGGSGAESDAQLFVPSSGTVIVASQTSSGGLFCPSGAYDSSYAGGSDLYVGRFSIAAVAST